VLLILLLLLLCLLLHHHHHRPSRKYISSKDTTSVVLISLCSNTESGSSYQGIQYIPSGDTVFESQTGSSQGNAGNFQFSSGEDTLENYNEFYLVTEQVKDLLAFSPFQRKLTQL